MFCDWLNVWQQHDPALPDFLGGRVVSIEGACGLARASVVDVDGVITSEWALSGDGYEIEYDVGKFAHHRGSYETTLTVRMVAGRLEVRGNPSAYGRLDNLFGVGLDEGIEIYNTVLRGLGLPEFTQGETHTNLSNLTRQGFAKSYTGAHISRFDGTQNFAVGMGRVSDYHKWIVNQKLYRSSPDDEALEKYARWNYKTVYTSESKFYINAKHYDKAEAISELSLPQYLKKLKAAEKEGRISKRDVRPLYLEAEDYLNNLALWCSELGISRGEWSIRSRYFTQHPGLGFWTPGETESAIWEVIGKEMEKVSGRAIVYQEETYDSLTGAEYKTLDSWKRGVDVKAQAGAKTTFYRHRAAILKKTGHDIAARPLVTAAPERRPVYFQVRALTLKDAPVWYQRPSVPFQMAA